MADKSTDKKTNLVRNLAEILVELDLNEIDVKDADIRIRVSRGVGGQVIAAPQPAPFPQAPVAVGTPVMLASDASLSSGTAVPSPMVGTVYLSASPEVAPYITVGSEIKEGDTLLIIEAMKTMNHIPATCSGTVTEILVEDQQPVEFGETLVVIE